MLKWSVTFVKYRLILNVEKEIIVGSMFKPRSRIYNHIAISGNYRVPKCDIIENEICEIMGFVKLFWKNNVQDATRQKLAIWGRLSLRY